jgi:peptidoglycan/xylan/chitin deacetylase (PgdA/CDA1 family)
MEASTVRDLVSTDRSTKSPWMVLVVLGLALCLVVVAGIEAQASSSVIRHGLREQPWVALTFDDGWSIDRCARIVRTLRAKRAPATFFVNGGIINRDPTRWRRLLEGFSVANHTLSHKDLTRLDAASIRSQIELNEKVIERIIGRPMLRLLRPSYGAYDHEVERIAAALGYHTILWDTDSGDGRPGATTRSIVRNGSRGGDGAIVLLHCGPAATPDAVGPIIARYRSRGYRLVDLGEMLDLEPPPIACRVTNDRTGDTAESLQQAARRAAPGGRLTLQGTCLGGAHIRKDLEISGIRTDASGTPTLDGTGRGTVVTVKTGVDVILRDLTIRAGGRGILNYGHLTLDGVIVQGNAGERIGAGVYNADGATLLLQGSSAIRRNTASQAGGGVLNAGTLVMADSASVTRNVVRDEGRETQDIERGTDPFDVSNPLLDGYPAGGTGGGIVDLGTIVGVVCAPAVDANIRGNSPDDCSSPATTMPMPWAEPPGWDARLIVPGGCPSSEDDCPTGPAGTPVTPH